MTESRPFLNWEDLVRKAKMIWRNLNESEQRAVFLHHPRIGSSEISDSPTRDWSKEEQSGVKGSKSVLEQFQRLSQKYEERFGTLFLVCATGKSASEMLEILRLRMKNTLDAEFRIAMAEQIKITLLRLEKLLRDEG